MGKTYFSLSDNLNFNGKTIKIKANSTEPPIKEEKKGRAYFNADFQSRIYQSILASQPQLVQVKSDSIIRMETDLRFLNSSAQVGRIEIEMGENGGYVVKTNVALNKVTTGAAHVGSAQVEEKEWIVVSGMQLKGFKYQFIETALHDIDNLIIEGVDPANITWIVFVHDYVYIPRDHDRERFSKTAENLGIKIQFIENRTEFIHYINTKTLDGSETLREKTKIKYLSVFAHGQTPKFTGGDETQLSFAYDFNNDEKNRKKINWEGIINFRMSEMQVLDPRNPTIYEFCTYNLDMTANVKIIGVTGTYVLPVTIDPMYNHKKDRTTYNTPVADRLFRLQSDDCYYYQYQEASPLLSIALGIKTYTIKLQVTNGNALLAVQEYNGNLTNQVTYMNDVNKLAYQGGFKNADFYP